MEELLQQVQAGCRLLVITGLTGVGKSALAAQLMARLNSVLPSQTVVNFDSQEASFVQVASYLQGVTSELQTAPSQQVVELAVEHLINQPCLLVLDSLEAILQGQAETGDSQFQDPVWMQFFHKLLAAEQCGSLVLITSQDFPADLETLGSQYLGRWHSEVLRGLTSLDQRVLFQELGLSFSTEDDQIILTRIGAAYEGHPLALRVIAGELLAAPFCGNLLAYWHTYGREIEALEQAYRQEDVQGERDVLALDRYTRHLRRAVRQRIERTLERLHQEVPFAYLLLCLASVYRRPVIVPFWLKMLIPLRLNVEQRQWMLDALRDRYLVEELILQDQLHLRQHNLIRSVALDHLHRLRGYRAQDYDGSSITPPDRTA